MILGIDIGGTNIKFGVVTDDYTLVTTRSIPTQSQRPVDAIITDIITTATTLVQQYDVTLVGVGTPGDIDSSAGVCIRAGNLPYKNTPLGPIISEALHMPVAIANDATAALYGELYAGAGKAYQNIIMLTLGTGVGGGIAINGQPYLGTKGYGGELGHMVIKYDGLPCPCGLRGCYEQYASVTALLRIAREAVAANPSSLLARMTTDGNSALDIFNAKAAGCPVAAAVLDQYTEYVAIGINSFENIFQPEAYIIGGAISNQGDNLLNLIRAKLDKPAVLCTSALKNNAGVIGAAVVAAMCAK